ncbi:MAG TPA: MraY family glycosyltransferase [Nitrospirota bacterium]|nr:MraY family glycosyltransferase [Nitrospirota bacterium]
MIYLTALLLSVFITVSLIPMMIRLADRYQVVDVPNPRKVHVRPVPRIGGLAMAVGVFIPIVLWALADEFVRAFIVATGILVVFGFIDDMKGLGYRAKFGGQILAALVIIFYGGLKISSLGSLLPGEMQLTEWLKIALTLVAIVGVTNAVNLADGLDGLAGGISLLSFCCIGYLAYLDGSNTILTITMAVAGAIFGFLRFNTHPASLFMGDTGSQLLGFSAVVLAVKTTQGNTPLSPVLPLIILGLPVLDTLTVMVHRISRGRSPFKPDKNHFHHRLINFGLSHSEAVFVIYVIQALMILSAIFFKYYSDWLLIAGYGAFSVAVVGLFAAADRKALRLPRFPGMENVVRDRLRKIRENNYTIRCSFGISKLLIPLLLVASCFIPARIPAYVSITAFCFSVLILGVFFARKKYLGTGLRLVLYLTVPLVLYCIEEGSAAWMSEQALFLYRLCFGIIAVFVMLTVKFSRRSKGFRMSTMDFLIIFIAVTVPNLPGQLAQHFNLGLLAVEIIVFFFGYEVLINELREKFDGLAMATLAATVVLSVRGYAGV